MAEPRRRTETERWGGRERCGKGTGGNTTINREPSGVSVCDDLVVTHCCVCVVLYVFVLGMWGLKQEGFKLESPKPAESLCLSRVHVKISEILDISAISSISEISDKCIRDSVPVCFCFLDIGYLHFIRELSIIGGGIINATSSISPLYQIFDRRQILSEVAQIRNLRISDISEKSDISNIISDSDISRKVDISTQSDKFHKEHSNSFKTDIRIHTLKTVLMHAAMFLLWYTSMLKNIFFGYIQSLT